MVDARQYEDLKRAAIAAVNEMVVSEGTNERYDIAKQFRLQVRMIENTRYEKETHR